MEARIREEMFNLGILSNKRGYIYIIEAVKRFNSSITMEEIYNNIASTVGKPRCAVESSIRTAIKTADHDLSAWKNYDCLTTRGFITTMYYRTREESANE